MWVVYLSLRSCLYLHKLLHVVLHSSLLNKLSLLSKIEYTEIASAY